MPVRNLAKAFLASIALPLVMLASVAHAACVPNGPGVPNGATVNCTGTGELSGHRNLYAATGSVRVTW